MTVSNTAGSDYRNIHRMAYLVHHTQCNWFDCRAGQTTGAVFQHGAAGF